MVCGDEIQLVNGHVKKHRLTVAEYRQRFPQAPLTSPDLHKKLSDLLKKRWVNQSTRLFHRRCSCGQTFKTRSPNGRFCQRCSHVNLRLSRRIHQRLQNEKKGTFRKNYLEVTSDGRVRGAVMLERGIGVNITGIFSGSKRLLQRSACFFADGFDYLIDYLVLNGEIYCGDCGSPVIIARENEHYSIPTEPCCKRCGLVYELT